MLTKAPPFHLKTGIVLLETKSPLEVRYLLNNVQSHVPQLAQTLKTSLTKLCKDESQGFCGCIFILILIELYILKMCSYVSILPQ